MTDPWYYTLLRLCAFWAYTLYTEARCAICAGMEDAGWNPR